MNYLEKIKAEGPSANPFFCLMGIDVVSAGDGRAVLKMPVRSDNGVGWLQGGMFTALADEAMALALYTVLNEHEGIATISESTSFVKGVRDGVVYAEGIVIKKGRRVAFAEGGVYGEEARTTLLSRSSAAFAVTVKK